MNGKIRGRSLAILACLLLCGRAGAADWLLTTGDLCSQPVTMFSVSNDGVQATGPAGTVNVGWADLVSIDRSDAATFLTKGAPFVLLLDGHERLAGNPVGVAGDAMLWREPIVGQLSVPLSRVSGLVRTGAMLAAAAAPKQDVVSLRNGDSVSGVFTACSEQSVTVQTDAGSVEVPLASISRISFAVTATVHRRATAPHAVRLRLTDGSQLVTECYPSPSPGVEAQPVGVTGPRTTFSLNQVLSLGTVDGPVLWLAEQSPSATDTTPYFGALTGLPGQLLPGTASAEASPDSRDAQQAYSIRMHARSQCRFEIPPGFDAFRTQFRIEPDGLTDLSWADVTVRIRLDDRVVFEQTHVRAGPAAPALSLPLGGARQLSLETDFGDSDGVQGRVEWLEPALLRSRATQH